MVPLPDTAIDFSDLRSQSSRMNERVSRKNTEIFVILLMRHAHLHKLSFRRMGLGTFSAVFLGHVWHRERNDSIRRVRTAGKILRVV